MANSLVQANPQVVDAITTTNVKVLGEAPAQALGIVYQVLAQSIGLSMQNAVSNQQGATQIGTASTGVVLTAIGRITEKTSV